MGPQELINQPSQHGPEMPSASVQVHAARLLAREWLDRYRLSHPARPSVQRRQDTRLDHDISGRVPRGRDMRDMTGPGGCLHGHSGWGFAKAWARPSTECQWFTSETIPDAQGAPATAVLNARLAYSADGCSRAFSMDQTIAPASSVTVTPSARVSTFASPPLS